MQPSDERVRGILELKEYIAAKIEGHEREIELLRRNLDVLDSAIKQSSFTRASEIRPGPDAIPDTEPDATQDTEPDAIPAGGSEPIPITRGTGGDVIANAYVTPEQVSIVINDGITLGSETPPFKSFFVERVIGEMQRKDALQVRDGAIPKESAIGFTISGDGAEIREIVISNYRQQERVAEIVNTLGWSFARMLENMER